MLKRHWLFVALSLVCGTFAVARADDEEKPEAITDPKMAGKDFAVQGEYLGEFDLGDGNAQKFGLQVVSLGEGKYKGVAYFGGLPGEGWDGFGKLEADAAEEDGVVKLTANEGYAIIEDGTVVVKSIDEQELGKLKKYERKLETEGAAPPEGAVVLFDGKNSDAWEGGKVTEEGFLTGGVKSKQSFGDHTLHVEFRTPYMPTAKGQARGNSGVYLQNRYEVQILDSFGLEGLDNECGGIYSKKAPRENMCLPPLTWQTYDIDFVAPKFDDAGKKTANAKVTVRHNGAVIHENYEIDGETPGGDKEGPGAGPILLQDHGNPVVFRNIWVVENKPEEAAAAK